MLREKADKPAKDAKAVVKRPSKLKTLVKAASLRSINYTPASKRKLPNAYRLFIQACKALTGHWEVFGGILLIYALINIVLIGGLTNSADLQALKVGLNDAFTGQFAKLTTGLALFGFLITDGPGTTATGVASAYQTISLLLISLAIIWALRQVYADHKIRVRDAFYNGMAPLIPFMLVMLYVGLQLLPAVVGGVIFVALVGTGILQQWYEIVAVGLVLFAGLVTSVYMLLSSVFAVYIVTLPDMTPWKAINSSKDIVRGRRGSVARKLLFLPLALLVCSAVILIPMAILLTPVTMYVFFAMTIAAIAIVHSYMYAVYRELIV